MYGEEWENAEQSLKNTKKRAIDLKDKERIDLILDLIKKAHNHEKVPLP
jgi:hypothetical protein